MAGKLANPRSGGLIHPQSNRRIDVECYAQLRARVRGAGVFMDQVLALGITSSTGEDRDEAPAACAAEARPGVVLVEHTEVHAAEVVGVELALAPGPGP
jgi:hypothetical protein